MAVYLVAEAEAASVNKTIDISASYFIIQLDDEGDGVHLILYSKDEFSPDTWHESALDAQNFANDDYGVPLSNWLTFEAQSFTDLLAQLTP